MLLQLSGVPGSGKSTLARALARTRPVVVLDTDVIKSALLASGVPLDLAGRATYTTALALVEDLLAQEREVVIDSPCRYRDLLDAGTRIAAAAGVRYAFVELRTDDPAVLLERLDRRTARISQVASSTGAAPGTAWEHGTAEATLVAWDRELVRPEGDVLTLDAAATTDHLLELVHGYLDGRR